jgi:rhamnose transport system permease protein
MNAKWLVPVFLIVITLLVGWRISPNFLDAQYLMESATLFAETGLIALAMTFVITSGHIDLSVGSMTVLTACLTAKLLSSGAPIPVAIGAGIVIGGSLGALNAALIHWLKASSFLVTVGTMALYRGLAHGIMGANSEQIPESMVGIDTVTFAGLTVPLWIVIFTLIGGALIIGRTVYGRNITCFGSNPRAAEYAGLPIKKLTTSVFLMSGIVCGIASLLMVSRYGLARHDFAKGLELDAITMVVVGGTSIRGGEPNIFGAFLAFVLIAMLRTVMGIANVSSEFQLTAIGALLVFAVIFSNSSHTWSRIGAFTRTQKPS